MKNIIRKLLRESSNEKFYSRTIDSIRSGKIKPPYFKYLKNIGLERHEIIRILQKFFNGVTYTSEWGGAVEDKNGNMLYHEQEGNWELKKYDERGNEIYFELFDGFWRKTEYNEQNLETYREDSDGVWRKTEYNEQNLETYREDSDGFWRKTEYDKYGDVIYQENNGGILIDER